jgi:E2/UBC family protein E
MSHLHHVRVFINRAPYVFEHPEIAGRAIKERAGVPLEHLLCVELGHRHPHEECGCERVARGDELKVVDNDQVVRLEDGEHFWSISEAAPGGVTVKINRKEYEFAAAHQTGRSIKERAGIPLTDVLFLDRPHEDEVIANDTKITLNCGECLHSAPPANYGNAVLDAASVGFEPFELLPQPDGWTFLVVQDYPLPEAFVPNVVRLLVKLPPLFPDAAPDMFWLNPQVRTVSGAAPQGTAVEVLLNSQWQRFSWHLLAGAWQPGTSTLRDFMRCIRARLEKRN